MSMESCNNEGTDKTSNLNDSIKTLVLTDRAFVDNEGRDDSDAEDTIDCSRIMLRDLQPGSLTLLTLPVEILMHIFHYLDAKFIANTLTHVCSHFEELFHGDIYWKTRISKQWPKRYPPVYEENFDWRSSCVDREEQDRVWRNTTNTCHHLFYCEGIYAPVDSVHLMQNGNLLATGSRDRYLNLIDLTKYDHEDKSSLKKMLSHSSDKHHKGWIWSIQSQDNIMYTGSWDTYIKMWDLNAGLVEVNKFKCKSAILGIHAEENWIVGAGFNHFLYMIDPRDGSGIKKKFHRSPVLCVVANDKYVISGSEDKTMAVFDRRAGRVYKTIKLEEYPMSISLNNNQLWVGDKGGLVQLYDATHGAFSHIKAYNVGHVGKVTGIQYTNGALFTSSTDKTIKVLEPNVDPGVITTLGGHTGEVARFCFQAGVLVSAGSDSTVGLWIPKNNL